MAQQGKRFILIVIIVLIVSLVAVKLTNLVQKPNENIEKEANFTNENKATQNIQTEDITDKDLGKLFGQLKELILKSFEIQYELKADNLNDVYTSEFIKSIETMEFYRGSLRPYNIIRFTPVIIDKNNPEDILIVVRYNDSRDSEYDEEIHFTKISNRYFISNIYNGK